MIVRLCYLDLAAFAFMFASAAPCVAPREASHDSIARLFS